MRFIDYPVDFSSKGSVCGISDTGILHESKDSTRPNRPLNNNDERSQRYDLSENSEVDDDDEMDGSDDDEIIDIVGDHSHVMLNSVQRNYEQQRFF